MSVFSFIAYVSSALEKNISHLMNVRLSIPRSSYEKNARISCYTLQHTYGRSNKNKYVQSAQQTSMRRTIQYTENSTANQFLLTNNNNDD